MLGIVTGIASEQKCLARLSGDSRPAVRCAGADAARARAMAVELVNQGCKGLLSFGTAGGLAPDIVPGEVIVADEIIAADSGRKFPTDQLWRNNLMKIIGGKTSARVAAIVASPEPVITPEGKNRLFQSTGGLAVDMESRGVAEAAAETGVPFLALRVVADSHTRRVPAWIIDCVREDGSTSPFSVMAKLISRPSDIMAVLLLGLDYRAALVSLRRVIALGGGRFGFDQG